MTWALNASKTFYVWKVGRGDKISFWHDTWAGDCSLRTMFWDLFEICNQPDCSVAQVWDGTTLKLTFRRCVDLRGMLRWNQLQDQIRDFPLSTSPDLPIWSLEPKGLYSVKSFYEVINFGGIVSPIGKSLWKVLCPQNIHVFMWLCVYNKFLTRDNLNKSRQVEDLSCLFCRENESTQHLFFDCVVAKCIWSLVSEFFNVQPFTCFEDICAVWRSYKCKPVLNLVTAASLWSIWRLRNDFCFQGRSWRGLNCVLVKLKNVLLRWGVLCDDTQAELLRRCILLLDKHRGELLRIAWT